MMRVISTADVAAQAWRNGGGRTQELLTWPAVGAWTLRISLAQIETDGPFSAFPGVQRWFTVVEGAGVALGFADAERLVRIGDPPLCFDGAAAPTCRLLDGSTRDLNLMIRAGRSTLRPAASDVPWDEGYAMRGLYTAVPGRWTGRDGSARVAAQSLLWSDAAKEAGDAWKFVADGHDHRVSAWWLGYTPAVAPR